MLGTYSPHFTNISIYQRWYDVHWQGCLMNAHIPRLTVGFSLFSYCSLVVLQVIVPGTYNCACHIIGPWQWLIEVVIEGATETFFSKEHTKMFTLQCASLKIEPAMVFHEKVCNIHLTLLWGYHEASWFPLYLILLFSLKILLTLCLCLVHRLYYKPNSKFNLFLKVIHIFLKLF